MKKLFYASLVAFMFLSFVGITYTYGSTGKVKIETVKKEVKKDEASKEAVAPKRLQLESKEALKIDDAEYTGAVVSDGSPGGVSETGVDGFNWIYALAGLIAMSAFALFGTVKGDETETDELKAIKVIQGEIDAFKKLLGDKLSKSDVQATEKELKELRDGLKDWTGEKIETSMKTINDAITKYGKQIEEMQEAVNAAKEGGKNKMKPGQFVVSKDVEDFVKATFNGSQKTKTDASIKLNGAMAFKAAETFGIPTFFEGAAGTETDAFTGRFIDPTLYQRKRKRNLIIDHFAIETISVPKLIYLEKMEVSGDDASSEDVGGADWITSGETKPPRSFRVTTGSVEAKKVAIFGTVEDKLLRDVPSLENWLREDFFDEMREEYNDGLLNNNPAIDEDAPLGLKQNAIQYAPTDAFDGTILAPNYIDMIVAFSAYLDSLKEQPGKVFVAGDVWYAMQILKDNDRRYQNNLLVYTNSLGQLFIAGVEVVKADAEDVPSTHILIISTDVGFKIKNYGPMVFERGLNGTDFKEDKTSYRGYQEVLSYIPTHRYNSVGYDTWANIEAAITAGS